MTEIKDGWRCPQCSRIYSPNQPMCYYCQNDDMEKLANTLNKSFEDTITNIQKYMTELKDKYEVALRSWLDDIK